MRLKDRMRTSAKGLQFALMAAVLLLPMAAHADFTLFCTGGNTCSTTLAGIGSPSSYYEVTDTNTITGTTSGTFDVLLTFYAFGFSGDSAGYLQSFSLTLFPNSVTLSGLTFDSGLSNGWTDLENLKSNNGGTCTGQVNGAFCASSAGSTEILLTSAGTTFGISGTYSGASALSSVVFLANATANQNGTGGNTLAISQDVGPGGNTPVPAAPKRGSTDGTPSERSPAGPWNPMLAFGEVAGLRSEVLRSWEEPGVADRATSTGMEGSVPPSARGRIQERNEILPAKPIWR